MPKINVYLPDDLATAVRDAGIPVSPVCQKALAEAVRSVARARKVIEDLRNPTFDPADLPKTRDRVAGLMTLRLRETMRLARDLARPAGRIRTPDLLVALVDEGHNLALRILRTLDVEDEELRSAAVAAIGDEADPPSATDIGGADAGTEGLRRSELSLPTRFAIASALEASIDLGHNYLGCEHLLLGLIDSTGGTASRVLEGFGVNEANARRAVMSATAGFAHARNTPGTSDNDKLEAILRRLDAMEERLSAVES